MRERTKKTKIKSKIRIMTKSKIRIMTKSKIRIKSKIMKDACEDMARAA
jgi:hypothetical protein